jgi:hypothetical protein
MRTRLHMASMLAVTAGTDLSLLRLLSGSQGQAASVIRERADLLPPGHNGKRAMERRLRQMQRKADKDARKVQP